MRGRQGRGCSQLDRCNLKRSGSVKTFQNLRGAAKEVVAEIVGDQNLLEEGRSDRRNAAGRKEEKPSSPVKGLHNLT
jgi:hypothetical protein